MKTHAVTIKVAVWRRILFAIRGIVRAPFLLIDLGAVRGKRPPRFPDACSQFAIDIHTATLGRSSIWLGRLSQTSKPQQWQLSGGSPFAQRGVQVLPRLANRDVLATVRDELESTESYGNWLEYETSPKFSFGALDFGQLGRILNDPEGLYALAQSSLCGEPLLVQLEAWALRDSGTWAERTEAALSFHCDADYFNFIKIFIPLRSLASHECTKFVEGSHLADRHALYRVDEGCFAQDKIWQVAISLGDAYMMNTSGWHSAAAGRDPRPVLQAVIATDLFGRDAEGAMPLSEALGSWVSGS